MSACVLRGVLLLGGGTATSPLEYPASKSFVIEAVSDYPCPEPNPLTIMWSAKRSDGSSAVMNISSGTLIAVIPANRLTAGLYSITATVSSELGYYSLGIVSAYVDFHSSLSGPCFL